MWKILKREIKGDGFSDAMTHLIDLYNFCFSAPSEVGNDNTKFEDSIEAIESQYPEDCDKVRLWRYQETQVCSSAERISFSRSKGANGTSVAGT